MENNNTINYNHFDGNPFGNYLGKYVEIQIRSNSYYIAEIIDKLDDRYLTLRHLHGWTSLIKLSLIAIIREIDGVV